MANAEKSALDRSGRRGDAPQGDVVTSEDNHYRYRLSQQWGAGPRAVLIVLHPPIVEVDDDDPVLEQYRKSALEQGLGGIVVVALNARRATGPRELYRTTDPVGPRNDEYLAAAAAAASRLGWPLIADWGPFALPGRVATVTGMPGMQRLQIHGSTHARSRLAPKSNGGEPDQFAEKLSPGLAFSLEAEDVGHHGLQPTSQTARRRGRPATSRRRASQAADLVALSA